jgi:hypothetical protein
MATAIGDYASLKTAIGEWFMARDFSSDADVFIDLAEAYFNIKLRCRQMETIASIAASSNTYALPSDYVEYKRVVEKASIRRRLSYITEDAVDQLYPDRASGLSNHFTIIGSTIYTYPLSSTDIELTYYAKIPALSGSATTNWLILAHPNLYLHACLLYAAEFTKDNEELSKESTFVQNYIDLMHAADNRAKFANAGVTLPGNVP